MDMKIFERVETLEELKREYKTLAMKYHPDRGGDTETMKFINAKYDEVFLQVKDTHRNKKGETYHSESTEMEDEFKDIIDVLLKFKDITIEIIGSFIWLSGKTKPYKEELKEMGFKWSHNKKMWYKSPDGYKRRGKKNYEIEEIRNIYKSKTVNNKADESQKLIANA